jgi:hypothetical protein
LNCYDECRRARPVFLDVRLPRGREKGDGLMGAHPYFYFVDYNPDLNIALEGLREREFRAGRYHPVMRFPPFPIDSSSPAPGPSHSSIEAAVDAAAENGTRSILDLLRVASTPDYRVAALVSDAELIRLFGTLHPTREAIETCDELFAEMEREKGVCIVAHKDGMPDGIFFAKYSFD